ncbi:MAG: hypothetical protein NXH83_19060 [Rhodobacteraceae bacterium]|nr:hypothetical protein [Paracoccaceae bacterium]
MLELIARLAETEGLGVLFISHDLGVVQRIAARTVVLQSGRVVEQGPTAHVLGAPQAPYTRTLVAAVPSGRPRRARPPSSSW